MLHVACPAPTVVQHLARGGRPKENTSDTLPKTKAGEAQSGVTPGPADPCDTEKAKLPFRKVTKQTIDGYVIRSKGRRKYHDICNIEPSDYNNQQSNSGSNIPLIRRSGKFSLGTFPIGKNGRYRVQEIAQCPTKVDYAKEDIPVWPNPTKAMRKELAGSARFDVPEICQYIARSTAMLVEWEQRREEDHELTEPKWPVLWYDKVVWTFKPRWSEIDVLLEAPTRASRPQMLEWLRGEKFHQYSHFGKVPTVAERSMVTDAPSDVRQTGETAESQVRADEQRGTPQTAMPVTRGRTRWLVDSGTGNHLTWAKEIEGRRKDIIKTDEALNLWTANGITVADERIPVKMKRLKTEITPLILEYTPNALSLGRLVVDEGFSFTWEA